MAENGSLGEQYNGEADLQGSICRARLVRKTCWVGSVRQGSKARDGRVGEIDMEEKIGNMKEDENEMVSVQKANAKEKVKKQLTNGIQSNMKIYEGEPSKTVISFDISKV